MIGGELMVIKIAPFRRMLAAHIHDGEGGIGEIFGGGFPAHDGHAVNSGEQAAGEEFILMRPAGMREDERKRRGSGGGRQRHAQVAHRSRKPGCKSHHAATDSEDARHCQNPPPCHTRGPMQTLTRQLLEHTPLDAAQITAAASQLVDPAIESALKADFLRALAKKGETPSEIAAFVNEFLKLAVDPGLDRSKLPGPMLDVVGTGGDQLHLFNVSTTAMFILAAGGVCVTKHGNRGITSKAGGADVLEALGIKIDLPKEKVVAGIEKTGLGFFFAPLYHPAFKAVAEARKLLAAEGQRSIFNMLGPLLNPGRPDYQLVGVFDPKLTRTFGEILIQLGRKGAWVVHGSTGDGRGMDELSSLGVNDICQVKGGQLENTQLEPQQLGFSSAKVDDLIGGEAAENAGILEGILAGTIQGPKRDIAVLNAAAGFVITGLRESVESGQAFAEELLQRGAAHSKLREMQSLC
jgi:anthranilate phosphoribosyltransferase